VSKLIGFDFHVEYRLGSSNVVADALSHHDTEGTAPMVAISATNSPLCRSATNSPLCRPSLNCTKKWRVVPAVNCGASSTGWSR
jgi:hypothetical protein